MPVGNDYIKKYAKTHTKEELKKQQKKIFLYEAIIIIIVVSLVLWILPFILKS